MTVHYDFRVDFLTIWIIFSYMHFLMTSLTLAICMIIPFIIFHVMQCRYNIVAESGTFFLVCWLKARVLRSELAVELWETICIDSDSCTHLLQENS